MSITLSKVEYTYIGSISANMADLLDRLSPEETPSRVHLMKGDDYYMGKLQAMAAAHPEQSEEIQMIIDLVLKAGEIDLAWG